MLEMMRGTPPPTWEQTCLKLSEEKRELQERITQLERENDALRADLLLWDKAGIGFTTEAKP
jgi:hypothetical protein